MTAVGEGVDVSWIGRRVWGFIGTGGGYAEQAVAPADLSAVRREQFGAAGRGEIEAVVHELLPLDDAVLAHRKMDAGDVFGRIVLTP